MTANWGDVPTWIAAIAAVVATIVGWWQLSGLNETLRMNGLTAILQIESDLHSRKFNMTDAASNLSLEKAKKTPNQKAIATLQVHLDACIEHYINAADRLAFCLKQGYVPEKDWRTEYREYFAQIIKDFPNCFGPDSVYRNIRDIHDRWQRM